MYRVNSSREGWASERDFEPPAPAQGAQPSAKNVGIPGASLSDFGAHAFVPRGKTTTPSRDRELNTEVCDGAVEGDQPRILGFGDVDAKRLVQRDDEVQKIHGIDVELFPKSLPGASVARSASGAMSPSVSRTVLRSASRTPPRWPSRGAVIGSEAGADHGPNGEGAIDRPRALHDPTEPDDRDLWRGGHPPHPPPPPRPPAGARDGRGPPPGDAGGPG